ncbi:pentapeptide repeat-containing protein [Micromonospora arborensis]|uniref:pentapeptide repeat-containing protein n=1 Tax=Micromonospora arborensis TaxID=2116518 RepID=UPI00371D2859
MSIYYTGRSVRATQNQVALQEQGQVTERFARAVEQLGSDQINVRLGALYSLERLMRDSPADLVTILQMLSGFVRERAKGQPTDPYVPDASPEPPKSKPPSRFSVYPRLPTDVQAGLTILGRIPSPQDHTQHIDLSGANLTGADLSHGEFSRANFAGATLRGAKLFDGHFASAILLDADLAYASVSAVDLDRAMLSGARLYGASVPGSSLREAYAAGADLRQADLTHTTLVRTTLASAALEGSDLSRADIEEASFRGSNLEGAAFLGVKHAETADFHCARLVDVRDFPDDVAAPIAC